MFKQKLLYVGALAAPFAMLAGNASAAAVDVTATTADITAQVASIGAIGLAVLGVIVAIKTYKWVRRAM